MKTTTLKTIITTTTTTKVTRGKTKTMTKQKHHQQANDKSNIGKYSNEANDKNINHH